jgi:hypothetical protein
LPMVARRSPAMTTPLAWVTATIVVPCGASTVPGGRVSRDGRRSGAAAPRNSVKLLLPGAV